MGEHVRWEGGLKEIKRGLVEDYLGMVRAENRKRELERRRKGRGTGTGLGLGLDLVRGGKRGRGERDGGEKGEGEWHGWAFFRGMDVGWKGSVDITW